MKKFFGIKKYVDHSRENELIHTFTPHSPQEGTNGFAAYATVLVLNRQLERKGIHKQYYYEVREYDTETQLYRNGHTREKTVMTKPDFKFIGSCE